MASPVASMTRFGHGCRPFDPYRRGRVAIVDTGRHRRAERCRLPRYLGRLGRLDASDAHPGHAPGAAGALGDRRALPRPRSRRPGRSTSSASPRQARGSRWARDRLLIDPARDPAAEKDLAHCYLGPLLGETRRRPGPVRKGSAQRSMPYPVRARRYYRAGRGGGFGFGTGGRRFGGCSRAGAGSEWPGTDGSPQDALELAPTGGVPVALESIPAALGALFNRGEGGVRQSGPPRKGLAIGTGLIAPHDHRRRTGGGGGVATSPTCGTDAPSTRRCGTASSKGVVLCAATPRATPGSPPTGGALGVVRPG